MTASGASQRQLISIQDKLELNEFVKMDHRWLLASTGFGWIFGQAVPMIVRELELLDGTP